MYHHKRKTHRNYTELNRRDAALGCSLCENITPGQLVRQTKYSLLIRNRVPYDLWEYHKVTSHLLVVPRRHVNILAELTREERLDMLQLCADYEAEGYNIYTRAPTNPRRSAGHQHTHLIKIEPRSARAGLYLRRPYLHVTL